MILTSLLVKKIMLCLIFFGPLNQGFATSKDPLSNILKPNPEDPYFRIFTPDDVTDFENMIKTYQGIGVVVVFSNQGLMIKDVQPHLPAAKAGLKKGDIITHIQGQSLQQHPMEQRARMLRGGQNTPLQLRVIHKNGRQETYVLRRQTVDLTRIRTAYHKGYLIVRFDRFSKGIHKRLYEVIQKNPRREGIIFDLRFNPGGCLKSLIMLANYFIPRGPLLHIIRQSSHEKAFVYYADANMPKIQGPVAVIIGPKSASASEAFAAILKDHQRGLVVGQKSFGKGTVQSLYPLKQGGLLRRTEHYYLTPLGKNIDGLGVEPMVSLSKARENQGLFPKEREEKERKTLRTLSQPLALSEEQAYDIMVTTSLLKRFVMKQRKER